MFDKIDALAEPQRDALRVALGASSGNAPDRFLVAVAVLNLLSATAEDRPLLCLVDDAAWLDAASMQTLGFVAAPGGGTDGDDLLAPRPSRCSGA